MLGLFSGHQQTYRNQQKKTLYVYFFILKVNITEPIFYISTSGGSLALMLPDTIGHSLPDTFEDLEV